DYDPMLAKVIAAGPDRDIALGRLDSALEATSMPGLTTNVDFLRFLLADDDVRAGRLVTTLVDDRLTDYVAPTPPDEAFVAAALAEEAALRREAGRSLWATPDGWRIGDNAGLVRY